MVLLGTFTPSCRLRTNLAREVGITEQPKPAVHDAVASEAAHHDIKRSVYVAYQEAQHGATLSRNWTPLGFPSTPMTELPSIDPTQAYRQRTKSSSTPCSQLGAISQPSPPQKLRAVPDVAREKGSTLARHNTCQRNRFGHNPRLLLLIL